MSAASSPESNRESEATVKKVKQSIAHAEDKLDSISASVANLNYEQCLDVSG